MEDNNKWIKNLRRRMEDYSEPVPSDLWSQLESELGAATPKVVPMWQRWQAVAAVALLLLASSLTMWFWHSPSADYIEQQSMEIAALTPTEPHTPPTTLEPEQNFTPVTPAVHKQVRLALANVAEPSLLEQMVGEKTPEQNKQIEEQQAAENPVATEEKKQETTEKQRAGTYSGRKNYSYIAPSKKKETNWAIGLSTGNTPFSVEKSFEGLATRLTAPTNGNILANQDGPMDSNPNGGSSIYPSYPVGSMEYAYNQVRLNSKGGKSDVKHRTPITFGASLRIGLDDKWAIETGLTYTMLSTDLRSGDQGYYYAQEQKLHYLGIPLKLNRQIWNSRRFEVYASAGGMVEKSVSGKLTTTYVTGNVEKTNGTEKVEIKPLQWSLSAAAGAQFKITEQLGIYAEPGVVYYFDDKSGVSTIRKEHPFNFNIQLGVRFTLPK